MKKMKKINIGLYTFYIKYITIGIKPCNTPHNSLHCPYKVAFVQQNSTISLHLPGTSTLIPKLDIVKECITSIEDNHSLYITKLNNVNI
jgi:hypothetical protein